MEIAKEDLEKILIGDLITFNKVMDQVVLQSVESTLRAIPAMLGKLIEITTVTKDLVGDLMKKNPEFADFKSLVAGTIQEVDSSNPGKDYQTVIELAEPLIKEKIRIFKQTTGV